MSMELFRVQSTMYLFELKCNEVNFVSIIFTSKQPPWSLVSFQKNRYQIVLLYLTPKEVIRVCSAA